MFRGNQIASMLEEFLWSEMYRSPVTRRFSEEVAKAQRFEGSYEVRRLADHMSVACFNAPPDLTSECIMFWFLQHVNQVKFA